MMPREPESTPPPESPVAEGPADSGVEAGAKGDAAATPWHRRFADRLCRLSIHVEARYAGRLGWLSLCLGIVAAGGIAFHLWTFVIHDPPVYCDRCPTIAVEHQQRWTRVDGSLRDRFAEPKRIVIHLCAKHASEAAADEHWIAGIFQQFTRTFLVSPTLHAIALIGGVAAFAGGLSFLGRSGPHAGEPLADDMVDPVESDYWVEMADAESLLPLGRGYSAFLYILGTEVLVLAALRQEVPLLLAMLYVTPIVPFVYSGRCFGFCRRWLSPLPD